MPAVVNILDHFSRFYVGPDERRIQFRIQRRQYVSAAAVELSDYRLRRGIEVLYCRAFSKKLGVIADAKINSCFLSGVFLQSWDDDLTHRAGQNRAAYDNRVTGRFILQGSAEQFTNAPDIFQIQIAICLTRSADADERQLRLQDGFVLLVRCAESSESNARVNDFCDIGLDNRRLARVYQVNFRADGIDADDLVTVLRQAPCGHRSNVTQSEDANSQSEAP